MNNIKALICCIAFSVVDSSRTVLGKTAVFANATPKKKPNENEAPSLEDQLAAEKAAHLETQEKLKALGKAGPTGVELVDASNEFEHKYAKEIAAKVTAGLNRSQAIEAQQNQVREDARIAEEAGATK
ncbi:MAG: hypothetical protein AAF065_11940 [Verrucomicrobiota bacterium]